MDIVIQLYQSLKIFIDLLYLKIKKGYIVCGTCKSLESLDNTYEVILHFIPHNMEEPQKEVLHVHIHNPTLFVILYL